MKEASIWDEGLKKKAYPKLIGVEEADVVVIGGGMAGIMSAYFLTKAGKRTIVLEEGEIGAGVTLYTTAILTQVIDTDLSDLIKMYGAKDAKMIYDSHKEAIDNVKKIIDSEKIACDFKSCSNFYYANAEKDVENLKNECRLMRKIGVDAKFEADGEKLGFPNFGYIEIKGQAKFHPIKFLYSLAKKMEVRGAKIYEASKVKKVESKDGKITVTTDHGMVHAQYAIITTYEPFNKPLRLYFKRAFYESYMMVADIERDRLKEGVYEDADNPYHYMRLEKGEAIDRLIAGGEDHRTDLHVSAAKSFNALKKYLKKILKNIPHIMTARWSGPILEPVDGLAYIGQLTEEKILYAMAFSGNGMTYSAISAIILRDYILGKENLYARIYSVKRIPNLKSLLIKGKDFSEELIYGAIKNTLNR